MKRGTMERGWIWGKSDETTIYSNFQSNRFRYTIQYTITNHVLAHFRPVRAEQRALSWLFSILVLVFVLFFFSAIISIIQFAEHKQNCECTASDGEPNAILNFQWAIRTCPFIHESISNIYLFISPFNWISAIHSYYLLIFHWARPNMSSASSITVIDYIFCCHENPSDSGQ